MGGCTDRPEQRRSDVTTTNPVYRCEELEDAVSVYDSIEEENKYDDLNENTIYLSLIHI